MENSKMHFKMYKSGKNWMVAGLMTTAVLAGLTLGNVNATEAHAAINNAQPVAASAAAQKTPATSAEIEQAKNNVNVTGEAKSQAQDAVNSAANTVSNLESQNAAVDAVSKAQSKYSDALDAQKSAVAASDNASTDLSSATNNYNEALNKANDAYHFGFNANGATQSDYNKAHDQAKAAYAKNTEENQKIQDEATKQSKSYSDQLAALKQDLELARQKFTRINGHITDVRKQLKQKGLSADDKETLTVQLQKLQEQLTKAQKAITDAAKLDPHTHMWVDGGLKAHVAWVQGMFNYYDGQAKAAAMQIQTNNDAVAKLDQAKSNYDSALANFDAARVAKKQADLNQQQAEKDYVDAQYANNLLNDHELNNLQTKINAEQGSINRYNAAMHVDDNWAAYSAASDSVDKFTKKVADGTKAVSDQQAKVDSANQALSEAQAAYDQASAAFADATKEDKSKAQEAMIDKLNDLDRAQSAAKVASAKLAKLQSDLRGYNRYLTKAQTQLDNILDHDHVTVAGQSILWRTAYNTLNAKKAQLKADQATLDASKENRANVADLQTSLDAAKARLSTAQDQLKSATEAYQKAVDYLASLTGDQNNNGNATKPGDQNNNGNATKPGDQSNNGNAAKPGDQNNNGNATKPGDQNNNGNATKLGENTSATVNGNHQSKVSVKDNGKKAVAATTAKVKKLPQTGNNSAAVVALGALTGMLGLGLAAKKREF